MKTHVKIQPKGHLSVTFSCGLSRTLIRPTREARNRSLKRGVPSHESSLRMRSRTPRRPSRSRTPRLRYAHAVAIPDRGFDPARAPISIDDRRFVFPMLFAMLIPPLMNYDACFKVNGDV